LIEIITGTMASGKSELLIRKISEDEGEFRVFYPSVDIRTEDGFITSRSGLKYPAIKIDNSQDILRTIKEHESSDSLYRLETIYIDEVQFITDWVVFFRDIVNYCLENNISIIASGLEFDFKGSSFNKMNMFMERADKITRLFSECLFCGDKRATKILRRVNGLPSEVWEDVNILEGDDLEYLPICNCCYIRQYYT